MLFTDEGTGVPWAWASLAFVNGLEWSVRRRGRTDQFACLYRRGLVAKLHWYIGALVGAWHKPKWVPAPKPYSYERAVDDMLNDAFWRL